MKWDGAKGRARAYDISEVALNSVVLCQNYGCRMARCGVTSYDGCVMSSNDDVNSSNGGARVLAPLFSLSLNPRGVSPPLLSFSLCHVVKFI